MEESSMSGEEEGKPVYPMAGKRPARPGKNNRWDGDATFGQSAEVDVGFGQSAEIDTGFGVPSEMMKRVADFFQKMKKQ